MPKQSKQDGRDDIQSILQHSGMLSPCLDRLEQVSSQMWQLEWKLVKRAANDGPVCGPRLRGVTGD